MKSIFFVSVICSLTIMGQVAFAADTDLPEPQKNGGPTVLETIDKRESAPGKGFPSGYLSAQDLATILWAATGLNRDGSKWTVPMASSKPPYVKIYVTLDEGCFLYDWKAHKLIQVSEKNVKSLIPAQEFAQKAPASIYFVGDGRKLYEFPYSPWLAEFPTVLAGAMSQNVYLACEAIGVGTRLIYSVNRAAMAEYFKLDENDKPLFAMLLGKR